jgi:hypothetical protein
MRGRKRKYPQPAKSYYRAAEPEASMYSQAQALSRNVDNLKTTVIYSVLGLGAATGLFFLARHFYKKTRQNAAENSSMEEGNPATYAKQLKMAFDNDNWAGWGTDEETVFNVFNSLPSYAMYQKVQKKYFDLYGEPLNKRLEDELSSEEYNEVIRIINLKV